MTNNLFFRIDYGERPGEWNASITYDGVSWSAVGAFSSYKEAREALIVEARKNGIDHGEINLARWELAWSATLKPRPRGGRNLS